MQQAYLSSHSAQQRGFTLIELIMVIVMLGILSIYAAPRMFNTGDFYARGFHDETLALLRYAQKTAIAQRRTVCVTFVSSAPASATLSIASAAATSTCDAPLTGPNQNCTSGTPSGSKGCITARSGISYSSSPTSLNFNGLGQPNASATFQISTLSGSAGNPIIVEAETGYVHD
jgi:MSHA pilin protein MshC